MRIYTYKGCSTCKKATLWLDAQGIDYLELPIRESPPSIAELQCMCAYQEGNLKKLFNVSGGDYRELNLKERLPDLSEEEAYALLASRGNLVKRPFLITSGMGLVGFKETEWKAALLK